MKDFSEEEIISMIKQGKDQDVVTFLYKKVLPVLKKYIKKRSGSEHDALDAFQDALLTFYKQVIKGTYDPKYKIEGYIFRLGVNMWLNKLKKDKSMTFQDSFEENTASLIDVEKELPTIRKEENILKAFFSNIGEKCIELLTYTTYYNLLLEDIMTRMEFSSTDAVKMQAQRCKKKLIEEIDKNPALLKKLRGIS